MEREALQDRYNDEFFEKAELRRKKLGYSRISVGKVTDVRIQHILDLLYQTHQCYYFGHFKAAIILGGSLLEQSLIVLFEELLRKQDSVSMRINKNYELVTESGGFSNFGLNTLVQNACDFGIIDEKRFPTIMTLKRLRNQNVHDLLPNFKIVGECFETRLEDPFGKEHCKIKIHCQEVKDKILSTDSEEIFAYYVLTRTRSLISHIFQERVKTFPPEKMLEEELYENASLEATPSETTNTKKSAYNLVKAIKRLLTFFSK